VKGTYSHKSTVIYQTLVRIILCLALTAPLSSPQAYGQAGQIGKTVAKELAKRAGKKTGKQAAKKASKTIGKEAAEEAVQKSSKTISKEIVEESAKRATKDAISSTATKKTIKEIEEVSASKLSRTMAERISLELGQDGARAASKEFLSAIGKKPAIEAQQAFLRKLGSETSTETFESIAKESMEKGAVRTQKTLSEKVVDKMAQLHMKLVRIIEKSKIYKELLEIRSKGAIRLTEKEMQRLMTEPENIFRALVKAKTGSKKGFIEFFIRLKMDNPELVTQLLKNDYIRQYVEKALRGSGYMHEWLMVKNFEYFLLDPKWGKYGDFLAMALPRLTQTTDSVVFKFGGKHGSLNSTTFHRGLDKIIHESKTIEELFINVKRYARANLTKEGFEEFMKAFELVMKAA